MELTIAHRDVTGKKVKALRKASLIPAIVYGRHLEKPIMITCDKNAFIKIYKAGGSSTAITLKGENMKELALVQDIQLDPINDYVLHVDFHAVKADEKVTVSVPVVLTGLAPIEKLGEGKVQLVRDTIEVEAFPQDLPHDITIDISSITTLNDVVFVSDLVVGSKVQILTDGEQAVLTVVALTDEAEEETTGTEDAAATAVAAQKEAEKKSD
jgi:large subunit ribosomal protein L25